MSPLCIISAIPGRGRRDRCRLRPADDGEDSCSEPDEALVRKLRLSAPLARPLTRRGESLDTAAPASAGRNPMAGGIGYEKPSLYRQFSLQPPPTAAGDDCQAKGQSDGPPAPPRRHAAAEAAEGVFCRTVRGQAHAMRNCH